MENYTFDQYQEWVGQLCRTPVEGSIMGLAGEAGEVVDLLKKILYHGKLLDREKLKLELGDVLWYVADVARQYGIPLSEVRDGNVAKLTERFPKGHFTPEDSAARADEKPIMYGNRLVTHPAQKLAIEAFKREADDGCGPDEMPSYKSLQQ